MSLRKAAPPAGLLFSVLFREERDFDRAARMIAERAGGVESVGGQFPFDRSDYYEREMGAPLYRRFLLADGPIPREELVQAKLGAWAIENALSRNGRRTVNIDPGLLTEENVVLATGKNYAHRIYLCDGVYADLSLVFENGEYRPLPWTYPDIASSVIRSFLGELRRVIRERSRRVRRGAS